MVDTLQKGWFSEVDEKLWPGQCFSLEYEQVLHHARSDFQDILVLKTWVCAGVRVQVAPSRIPPKACLHALCCREFQKVMKNIVF